MSLYIYCTCTACIYIWKLTRFINYSKNILVVCNAFHHHYSSNNAHPFVSAFGNERFKFKQKLINLTLWHFHAEIYVHNTSACNCIVLNLFQNKKISIFIRPIIEYKTPISFKAVTMYYKNMYPLLWVIIGQLFSYYDVKIILKNEIHAHFISHSCELRVWHTLHM